MHYAKGTLPEQKINQTAANAGEVSLGTKGKFSPAHLSLCGLFMELKLQAVRDRLCMLLLASWKQ